MRRRLAVIFALIVLGPLALVAGLGFKVAKDQAEMTRIAFRELLDGRLADLSGAVTRTRSEVERDLLERFPESRDAETLRDFCRHHPLVRSVFVLDSEGRLVFPDPRASDLSESEKEFLVRTEAIWSRRAILNDEARPETMERRRGGRGDSMLDLAQHRPYGWLAWYWKEGLHLLLYRRSAEGGLAGVEVERIALLARVVGTLPDLALSEGLVLLLDSRGAPVYRWGFAEVSRDEAPAVRRRLDAPLETWSLAFYPAFAQRERFEAGIWPVGWGLGALALLVALSGMAIYFYRESSREMREAAQRVGFVTQVSHELKTPLANIRLYAELLEHEMDPAEDDGPLKKLHVIVAECQRLGRLIDNILAFARARRGALPVELARVSVEDALDRVLANFSLALRSRNIEVDRSGSAPQPVEADADKVEQVLSNLVSNVEKYGASGRVLFIQLGQDALVTRVVVGDAGPGVSASARRRIFEPFFRASDLLTDGVTGTGIGLSIARTLARACQGDLRLLERTPGAWFELTLRNAHLEKTI